MSCISSARRTFIVCQKRRRRRGRQTGPTRQDKTDRTPGPDTSLKRRPTNERKNWRQLRPLFINSSSPSHFTFCPDPASSQGRPRNVHVDPSSSSRCLRRWRTLRHGPFGVDPWDQRRETQPQKIITIDLGVNSRKCSCMEV